MFQLTLPSLSRELPATLTFGEILKYIPIFLIAGTISFFAVYTLYCTPALHLSEKQRNLAAHEIINANSHRQLDGLIQGNIDNESLKRNETIIRAKGYISEKKGEVSVALDVKKESPPPALPAIPVTLGDYIIAGLFMAGIPALIVGKLLRKKARQDKTSPSENEEQQHAAAETYVTRRSALEKISS